MRVSILVPVYGVEKYIERCAVSLLEQTYGDIEYIFVDDCSPDGSIGILRSVVARHPERSPMVRIIRHERNRGLSAARITAIEVATGEFLMHVDSDDWVERNAVELCVEKQRETGADFVYFDGIMHHAKYSLKMCRPDFMSARDMALAIVKRDISVNIWGALIRTSLQQKHKIYPEEGVNMGEDYQQTPRVVYYATAVSHLPRELYHYEFANADSYCNSGFSESKYQQSLRSFQIIYDFCRDKGDDFCEAADIAMLKRAGGNLIDMVKHDIQRKHYKENLDIVRRSDRRLWRYCSPDVRIAMYVQNMYVVAAYVKMLRPLKHLLLKLREAFR